MPQPNWVPVNLRTSRKYHNSGKSGAPSKERSTPFTFNGIMYKPPGRGTAILFQSGSCKSNRHTKIGGTFSDSRGRQQTSVVIIRGRWARHVDYFSRSRSRMNCALALGVSFGKRIDS